MIREVSDHKIFSAYEALIPYFSTFLEDDAIFSITNTENFLMVKNCGELIFNGKSGDKIPEGSVAYEALKQRKVIASVVPKEVFGVAVKGMSIPVENDEGEIIGTIGLAKSLKKQEEILNASQNLASTFQQIAATANQISAGIQDTAISNEEILMSINNTNNEVKNTDDILSFIKKIAGQTNLLGLNAAIEAARAGEIGRGFSVVASEIRKLSDTSGESIDKINLVLKKIQDSVETIKEKVNHTNDVFQEQAAGIQELTVAIEALNTTAESLRDMAQRL